MFILFQLYHRLVTRSRLNKYNYKYYPACNCGRGLPLGFMLIKA